MQSGTWILILSMGQEAHIAQGPLWSEHKNILRESCLWTGSARDERRRGIRVALTGHLRPSGCYSAGILLILPLSWDSVKRPYSLKMILNPCMLSLLFLPFCFYSTGKMSILLSLTLLTSSYLKNTYIK